MSHSLAYAWFVKKEGVAKNPSIQHLAGEFADLLSIAQDLAFTSAAARRISTLNEDDNEGVLLRSLWWASIVAYRRCFTSGRGHGLVKRSRLIVPEATIEELSPSMREIHDLALKEANEHVAHRVDDQLGQMPISLLFHTDESGSDEVAGVVALGATNIGPPAARAEMLADLADYLKGVIDALAVNKQRLILDQASTLLAE